MIIPWSTGKLVQLSSIGEDDECNLGITKDGKLVGFLQKSVPSFCKGHLSVDFVLNSLQLHSSSTHFFSLSFSLAQLTKPNQIIHFSFYRKFNSYFGSVCQCALCFSIYTISVPDSVWAIWALLRILYGKSRKIIIKQINLRTLRSSHLVSQRNETIGWKSWTFSIYYHLHWLTSFCLPHTQSISINLA